MKEKNTSNSQQEEKILQEKDRNPVCINGEVYDEDGYCGHFPGVRLTRKEL